MLFDHFLNAPATAQIVKDDALLFRQNIRRDECCDDIHWYNIAIFINKPGPVGITIK